MFGNPLVVDNADRLGAVIRMGHQTCCFFGAHIGSIRHPQLVRVLGFELTPHQLRAQNRHVRPASGDRQASFTFVRYGRQAHQPGGLSTTEIDSVTARNKPHLPHTANTVINSIYCIHAFSQHSVTKTASTESSGFRLAIITRGYEPTSPAFRQRLADELDREMIPVLIDEPNHF